MTWLLIDIGDVLLLKNRDLSFTQLLAEELNVDDALAQEINRIHFTTMEAKYVSEEAFIVDLKNKLGYGAPKNIFTYFSRAYRKQVRPNAQFLSFLDEVRTAGVKTAVLSNTIAVYRDVQETLGISKAAGFDPILYSWEIEMRKPDKEIFELALRRLHAVPGEVVFIDDKTGHLDGAKEVGMGTLLFDTTENVIAKIRQLQVH